MGKQLELLAASGRGPPRKRRRIGRKLVPLGRRPKAERVGFVPHVTRETHDPRCPVHVTMRRVAMAPSFRSERVSNAICFQLARAGRSGSGVRIVQFSIQHDHLHLVVEGTSREDLSRQAQKLFSRIALAVNAVAGRRGSLFRDRHHRHELRTPTETRNALVYILFNSRKHAGIDSVGNPTSGIFREFDPLSSAAWFHGWNARAGPPSGAALRVREAFANIAPGAPVVAPDTWLARIGWQRGGGPIRFDELPRIHR